MKDINLSTLEAQQTSSRINSKEVHTEKLYYQIIKS